MRHYLVKSLLIIGISSFLAGCPGVTSVNTVKSDVTETNRVVSNLLPPEIAMGFLSQQSDDGCAFTETNVRSRQGNTRNYGELRAVENYVRATNEYLLWLFYESPTPDQPPQLICSWARLDNKRSEKLLTALASLGAKSGCAGATANLGDLLPPEIALSFMGNQGKNPECSFSEAGAQTQRRLAAYADLRFKENAEGNQVELHLRQGEQRELLCQWINQDTDARRKLLTALASLGVGPLCN